MISSKKKEDNIYTLKNQTQNICQQNTQVTF